ncbi:MAG TPA: hypothetical protein EYN27_10970 [Rhodospirillales bacterium]|nr:hypothetical protein [Rhodospirillales bacterium]HIO39455.1 hypothetical protein [Rhodospirillales bacterium]
MKTLVPVDEDRKVVLYTRDLKQGKTYYARFRVSKTNLSNNQEYIRESMQTPNMEIASEVGVSRGTVSNVLKVA